MDYVLLALGLVLLLAGGEVLVRGGVGLAARSGLSPAVIGAVVLGFGTSMPELVTSVQAALRGAPGIAVGNVVGSNIANVLLILGLTAAVAPVPRAPEERDAVLAVLIVTAFAALLLLGPDLGRVHGAALLAGLALYIWRALRRGGQAEAPEAGGAAPARLGVGLALSLGGIAMVLAGAHLLVDGATTLARRFGVAETVIGLTLVAVGTSLPELATSLVAAWRGQGRMAVGNILGSNVFNVLGILGVTALAVPIPVPPGLSAVDLAVFAASAAVLALALPGPGLGRGTGVAMLAGYGAYLGWLAGAFG